MRKFGRCDWSTYNESVVNQSKIKAAREELRKIGRHIHSIYNENVVNKIKIEKVYVINDDPFAKFGPDFQKVKKMFSNIDVLELTSVQMGNLIRKGT